MDDTKRFKKSIEESNLSSQVYAYIKRLIMTQQLKGGERIPEEAIANAVGVSRTPIREALRLLEKNGLVTIYPRKYAEVYRMSTEEKKDIGIVRIHLDVLTVRLLCEIITEQQYHELKELAEKTVEYAGSGDIGQCFEADSELHCRMAEMAGNKYLYDFVKKLDLSVQLLRNIEDISVETLNYGVKLHVPMIEAIYRRDTAEAENLVRKHLSDYYFGEEE